MADIYEVEAFLNKKKAMESPITGKKMVLKCEKRIILFRKENIEIDFYFWLCEDTNEKFEDEQQAESNIQQVYNKYRVRHNIPTTNEILRIREMYNIPANKMADILGFGTNQYRQYESGEIPSVSNGRLIMLAADPKDFIRMVKSAKFEIGENYANETVRKINEQVFHKEIVEIVD